MASQIKRFSLLVLGAVVAIFVLQLSYPRVTSSISYFPVEAALKHHWKDYPIKQSQFPVLIDIANKSILKLDIARYWRGLAWLHYFHAVKLRYKSEQGQQSMMLSLNAFEKAIQKAPADPTVWLRIAWIHMFLGHEGKLVIYALKMSIFTGRVESYLMLNRLDLILRYVSKFEESDLSMIEHQIQIAWRLYPQKMLENLRQGVYKQQTLFDTMQEASPQLVQEIKDKL